MEEKLGCMKDPECIIRLLRRGQTGERPPKWERNEITVKPCHYYAHVKKTIASKTSTNTTTKQFCKLTWNDVWLKVSSETLTLSA